MPDWCRNRLEVKGPAATVREFRDDVSEREPPGGVDREFSELSFERHLPTPAEMLEADDGDWPDENILVAVLLGHIEPVDSFSWRAKNWGTKWSPSEATVEAGRQRLRYDFGTAWAPPLPWLAHVAALYPKLDLELFHATGSTGICGRVTYQRGSLVSERQIEDVEQGRAWLVEHGIDWWDPSNEEL
jgi:hypothetical protein